MPQSHLREYAKRLSKAEQDELRPKLIEERKRLKEKRSDQTKKKIRA
jgi:hypothetical protein